MESLTLEEQRLVEDNHNLIYSFIYKHLNGNIDEYYDVCAISLCKAIKTYNTNQNVPLSSYAYCIIMNDVKAVWRATKAQHRIPNEIIDSYNEPISNGDDVNNGCMLDVIPNVENLENLIIDNNIVNVELDKFDEMHRGMIELCLAGYKQKEVAKKYNVAKQTVNRYFRKFAQNVYDALYID